MAPLEFSTSPGGSVLQHDVLLNSKPVPIMHLLQISIKKTPHQILTVMQAIKVGSEDFGIKSSFSGLAKLTP